MRLTRAATRALQRQGGHLESPPPSTTIDVLPEDVLLEIFDSCRQTFAFRRPEMPRHVSERSWNSKNGWFKLAHVCRKWRYVVLSSSSRLHVRLLFTSRRPSKAIMLTRLPPLPIVVDYGGIQTPTLKEDNRLAAALRYPNRVCGITIAGWHLLSDGVYRAMNHPFPILESFTFRHNNYRLKLGAPMTIFSPSLRYLHLEGVSFASVSQLLSFTTGLVELDLGIDTIVCPSPAASLLTYLQGMPCLRHLHLWVMNPPSATTSIPAFPMRAPEVVPLPRLTYFRFSGSATWFEVLAAGLAAPFLQDLEVQLDNYSPTFPHLSRFIGDVEGLFSAVRVDITPSAPRISMLTHSHSIDGPPHRIAIQHGMTVQTRTAFGARLTTAEQLFLHRPYPIYKRQEALFHEDPSACQWRRFFKQFRNVKILRVGGDLLLEVARFLLLNTRIEGNLHLLPALEEVELRLENPDVVPLFISDIGHEEVHFMVKLFVAARRRLGHPVRVSWNADPALPSPYG